MEEETNDNKSEHNEQAETPVDAQHEAQAEAPAQQAEPSDPRDEKITALQAQVDNLTAKLRTVSKAFTDQKDEMAAFRKRAESQAAATQARKAAEMVRTFFEPVQNLQRSVDEFKKSAPQVAGGLELVQRQFMQALTKLGMEPIPGEGATFDPNVHEALALAPVTDEAQDGKVLMVHRQGYMVDGKALLPSQVVVGKFSGAAAEG